MYATVNPNIALRYLDNLRYIKLEITGEDIHRLGISPSQLYQKCFGYILEEKLKNPAIGKSQEIKLAKNFFAIS